MIFLFEEFLKIVEGLQRDIAGFDSNYDEIKKLFGESWKGNYIYI